MDSSVEVSDVSSPRTTDHDDIDFNINSPRDQYPTNDVDLSSDHQTLSGIHCGIPSILVTEPSCVNIAGLADETVTESQAVPDTSKGDESIEVEAVPDTNKGDESSDVEAVPDTIKGHESSDVEAVPDTNKGHESSDMDFVQDETGCSNKSDTNNSGGNVESLSNNLSGSQTGEVQDPKGETIQDENEHVEIDSAALNSVCDSTNWENNKDDTLIGTAVSNAAAKPTEKENADVISQSINMKRAEMNTVKEEVYDAVSLDNILMKDKTDSDSDSEFDFDLPTTVKPADQTPTVDPQGEQQERNVTAINAKPVIAHVPPVGSPISQTSSSTTQIIHGSHAGYPSPQTSSSTTQIVHGSPAGSPISQTSSSTTQIIHGSPAGYPSPQKPVAIIKPTTQAPTVTQPPPDEGTQRVLQAARAEWDNVTTIQAGYTSTSVKEGSEPTVIQTVTPMSPHELLQTFQHEDFADVKSSIIPAVERHGFAVFVNFLFGPPKLHRDLLDERDLIFCIAASQLNNDNSAHIRTLQTIYRCLTGSKFDCPRIGGHWEEIGFQGTDPATDLRGAGLLGLLNLLHLLKDPKKYQLANDIYRLSLHPTQNFPFCVMGINLSRIILQTMREGVLNKECNRRGEVVGVVNDFYVGLYLQMYQVWKGQGKTITDSGYVIKDIELKAKKTPRDVFKNLEDYLNRKTVVVGEKSSDIGGDNFINICDDGP